LLDGQSTLWKTDLCPPRGRFVQKYSIGAFSLSEQFVVIFAKTRKSDQGMYVLDAFSGGILRILGERVNSVSDCQFVSDEDCVILSKTASGSCLQLFNVQSGELLNVIDLERGVSHLAVCPLKRLVAIESDSKLGFDLIQVHLPQDKDSRKSKR